MGYFLIQIARICETTIISVGAHLTTTVTGIFFLGIPAMVLIGSYGMVIPQRYGFSLSFALLISFLLSFLVSLIFVALYFKLSKDSFTVFTLSSLLAVQAIIKSWDSLTGGVLGISGISRPSFLQSLSMIIFLDIFLAIMILIMEYIILKTWLGRCLLGMKENNYLVESLQISAKKLGAIVIIISGLLASLQGILAVWRIQFLDTSFGSVLVLVQMLTIAIIAAKPKVSWLLASTVFIVLLPEVFRFLNLPSTMIGYLRNILYSFVLILVLLKINKKHVSHKRFV